MDSCAKEDVSDSADSSLNKFMKRGYLIFKTGQENFYNYFFIFPLTMQEVCGKAAIVVSR